MQLGDILIARGLVTQADIDRALQRQQTDGGRLGDNLLAIGAISQEDLSRALNEAPAAPNSVEVTGIASGELINLLLKCMAGGGLETPSQIANTLKLPNRVVNELLKECTDRKLVDILGSTGDSSMLSELRHALSEHGKRRASEAMEICQYSGPAPVTLNEYHTRIERQAITNERIDRDQVREAFANLVISDEFVRRVGPAINSGRCLLLYGPPGNGKTSVAEKVGRIFNDVIYIPYCIEVEGQIIKVFDPSIHTAVGGSGTATKTVSVRREEFDKRWVACQRPIIVTGGELTLEMLDLKYNPHARFYEAPLHVKAMGGTFIIDDFGRQLVSPEEVLNRWIVPLQNRIDYLKLHTGKSFAVPFDELVIFSTNMEPDDLMDPAFLRRIPYKLETTAPSEDEFRQIFEGVAVSEGLVLPPEIFQFVVEELTVHNSFQLACYQPRFIVDQVIAICKFEGVPPAFNQEMVSEALSNLYTKSNPGRLAAPEDNGQAPEQDGDPASLQQAAGSAFAA